MAHGGNLTFPPCTPFSPVCCIEACGTLCGFFKLEALAPSPAAVGRLSARCHSAAPNFLGAVAAPLCSDSLPRPLRARHRRASPRVLELHRDVLPPLLRPVLGKFRERMALTAPCARLALRSLRRRRVRTSPYKSVQVRIPPPTVSALRNVLCQPSSFCLFFKKNFSWLAIFFDMCYNFLKPTKMR